MKKLEPYLYRCFMLISLMSLIMSSCSVLKSPQGKHLFILSGQSNMVRLDLDLSFKPTLEREFGKDKIIVVKDSKGAQSISRWYKKAEIRPQETSIGDLYDSLMVKVNKATQSIGIQSVTFVWMQGERDARLGNASVYEAYLIGLYKQLSVDLKRDDINFIIGRLNDFDTKNEKWSHWTKIRDIQVNVAESNPRFDWVNTDQFNDGINAQGNTIFNDLHMSVKGFEQMGNAFAEKAIQLTKQDQK